MNPASEAADGQQQHATQVKADGAAEAGRAGQQIADPANDDATGGDNDDGCCGDDDRGTCYDQVSIL